MHVKHRNLAVMLLILGGAALPLPAVLHASAIEGAQASSPSSKVLGTVTAVQGNSITVKTDAGSTSTATVNDSTRMLRTAPGQKSLAGATKIQISDLAVGDRVLVILTPATDSSSPVAATVVAMKQADIAEKQHSEEADWQKRGVGGLVKTVDTANGIVAVASGSRTITIKMTSSTVVRRYAPNSIKFSDATTSTLDQIHPGDQLRARGERNADSSEVAAEEIVSGSFKNIAGTVVSIDPAQSTVTVTDLATKKPVTLKTNTDSQLHKLPTPMAQMIAARLKGGATAGGSQAGPMSAMGPVRAGAQNSAPGGPPGSGSQNGMGGGPPNDLSRVLQRAPAIQLPDLHKGDAIMIVATEGNSDATTIVSLLAGVEPMLQASASASQSMFSASWSLGGGGDAASAAAQ